jgi:hypothetical protein
MITKTRASAVLLMALLATSALAGCQVAYDATPDSSGADAGASTGKDVKAPAGSALAALKKIPVKGRGPTTGYSRDEFGTAWTDTDHNGCDQRNDVLRRDLTDETFKARTHNCIVLTGTLADPYTGKTIAFRKQDASAVQIDHLVALQNAWVTGASKWTEGKRTALATDPLNLLAVDGPTNSAKGAGDAATWLPPVKSYRCRYVARQIAVKVKYGAWMTSGEHKAVEKVLSGCPDQKLPQANSVAVAAEPSAGTAGSSGSDSATGSASAGAFCSPAGKKGVTDAGTTMVCSSKNGDPARWRSAP